MDMGLSKLWEMVKDRETLCAAVRGVTKGQTWRSNWTTATNNAEPSNPVRPEVQKLPLPPASWGTPFSQTVDSEEAVFPLSFFETSVGFSVWENNC